MSIGVNMEFYNIKLTSCKTQDTDSHPPKGWPLKMWVTYFLKQDNN